MQRRTPSPPLPEGEHLPCVRLEFFSWLNKEFGTGTEGSSSREVPLVGDGTVRALFAHLAADSEPFRRIVYDVEQERLREYVALIVNGQAIELAGGLDRRLEAGDHLLLLPGFSGG